MINLFKAVYTKKLSLFIFNLRKKKYVYGNSIVKIKNNFFYHNMWLKNFFFKKKNRLYVIKLKKKYIGYVRLDYKKNYYYVSWALLKKYSNKGYMTNSLSKATKFKLNYRAVIFKNNLASIKVAEKNNFFKYRKQNNKFFFFKKNK